VSFLSAFWAVGRDLASSGGLAISTPLNTAEAVVALEI
jgi:hypothetical protein